MHAEKKQMKWDLPRRKYVLWFNLQTYIYIYIYIYNNRIVFNIAYVTISDTFLMYLYVYDTSLNNSALRNYFFILVLSRIFMTLQYIHCNNVCMQRRNKWNEICQGENMCWLIKSRTVCVVEHVVKLITWLALIIGLIPNHIIS
jgi:hypothetical protein